MKLKPNEKLNIRELMKDIENYRPKRRGWVWRKHEPKLNLNGYDYTELSTPLQNSVPLPAAKYFNNIDPQPLPVITTEIASGRFENGSLAWC